MKEMDKNPKQNLELDIISLLKTLLSKLWLMILVGAIAAGGAFCVTKIMIKPTYRCSFTAYVNNRQAQTSKDTLTSSDLSAAKMLVETYTKIICSNSILTAAGDSIHSDLSYPELRGMVTTEIQGETEIISVHVISRDPQFSYDLANAIASVAPGYMSEIVEGSSMKIIDYPMYSSSRYKPSYFRYAVFGFFAGVLLVMIFVIIRYFLDDTVKNESDVENRFGLPILGVIPDLAESSDKRADYYSYEYGGSSGKHNEERSEKDNEKKES